MELVGIIDHVAFLVGPWLAAAVALRTALQATVVALDWIDDRLPKLQALTHSLAGACEAVDDVVRVVGVKSMQGSARALNKVLTK